MVQESVNQELLGETQTSIWIWLSVAVKAASDIGRILNLSTTPSQRGKRSSFLGYRIRILYAPCRLAWVHVGSASMLGPNPGANVSDHRQKNGRIAGSWSFLSKVR